MIKKLMSLLLAIVAIFSGFSVKSENGIIKYRDMPYGIRYKRQILDLDIPEKLQGDVNMIMYIHGGGWTSGSKDDLAPALDQYAEFGCVSAALNYRYCGKPNHATMDEVLQDISSALAKIKETAAERGVNIKGVILSGGSAGAHLALLYAYKMADKAPIKPVAVYALSPAVDLTDSALIDGTVQSVDPDSPTISPGNWLDIFSNMIGRKVTFDNIDRYRDELYDCSPIKYVSGSSVPTVIAHATKDTVLPYAKAAELDKKLTEYGVTHEFITFNGSSHGLDNCPEASELLNAALTKYNAEYLSKVS